MRRIPRATSRCSPGIRRPHATAGPLSSLRIESSRRGLGPATTTTYEGQSNGRYSARPPPGFVPTATVAWSHTASGVGNSLNRWPTGGLGVVDELARVDAQSVGYLPWGQRIDVKAARTAGRMDSRELAPVGHPRPPRDWHALDRRILIIQGISQAIIFPLLSDPPQAKSHL